MKRPGKKWARHYLRRHRAEWERQLIGARAKRHKRSRTFNGALSAREQM